VFKLWGPAWITDVYLEHFPKKQAIDFVHYDDCGLIAAYVGLGGQHTREGGYIMCATVHRQARLRPDNYFMRLDTYVDPAMTNALPEAFRHFWMLNGRLHRLPLFFTALAVHINPKFSCLSPKLSDLFDPQYLAQLPPKSIWVCGNSMLLVQAAIHHILYNLRTTPTQENVARALEVLMPYVRGISMYEHISAELLKSDGIAMVLTDVDPNAEEAHLLEERVSNVYYYGASACGHDSALGREVCQWLQRGLQKNICIWRRFLANTDLAVVVPDSIWKKANTLVYQACQAG